MTVADQKRWHVAYVLRMWVSTSTDGQRSWRALLEDVQTGERYGFTSSQQLAVFLEAQDDRAPPTTDDAPSKPAR